MYFLLMPSSLAFIIGIMQKTGIGNTPNQLCLVSLNSIMKSLLLAVQGLICLVMTFFGTALSKHISQTRKAAGRKRSTNEKLIQTRFAFYCFVVIASFVLQMIHEIVEINNNVLYITVLILQMALAPFAFPIIFVLSTRQYGGYIKRLFKSDQNNSNLQVSHQYL